MAKKATWKIIKRGGVPRKTNHIMFTCLGCGHEAELPIHGLPMAQVNMAVVFDRGSYAMPSIIQCRKCRRLFQYDVRKTL